MELQKNKTGFVDTGIWSKKAIIEAKKIRPVKIISSLEAVYTKHFRLSETEYKNKTCKGNWLVTLNCLLCALFWLNFRQI